MDGKIDSNGCLRILRGNKYKLQRCIRDGENFKYKICGDGCPLFGDPTFEKRKSLRNMARLPICVTTFFFDNFVDERIKPQKEE